MLEPSQIAKTSFLVVGVIGIEAYGMWFTVTLGLIFIVLCVRDTLLGFYMARRSHLSSSRIWTDGIMDKLSQGILAGIAVILTYNIAYQIKYEYIDVFLSIAGALPLIGVTLGQISSIVENQRILVTNPLQIVFRGSIARLLGIGMERITKKAEKYVRTVGIGDLESIVKTNIVLDKKME